MDIEQARAKWKKRQEEEEENKNKGDFSNSSYEYPEYTGLKAHQDTALRLVGNPVDFRVEPWDLKVIHQSQLIHDSGKYMVKINWPYLTKDSGKTEIDKDWILYRLYESVMEHSRVTNSEGKSEKSFYHKNTQVFRRMNGGNKLNNWKIPANFFPTRRLIGNVINRHEYDWHVRNKKYKILCSKHELYKDADPEKGTPARFNTEVGVPFVGVYENGIMARVLNYRGDWNGFDIIVNKDSKNKSYIITHIFNEDISPEAKHAGTDAPLTPEELSWAKWDLNKHFPDCSYSKLNRSFKQLFKDWDAYAGTNFYDELKECVRIEKEERERKRKEEGATTHQGVNVPGPAQSTEPIVTHDSSIQDKKDSMTPPTPEDLPFDDSSIPFTDNQNNEATIPAEPVQSPAIPEPQTTMPQMERRAPVRRAANPVNVTPTVNDDPYSKYLPNWNVLSDEEKSNFKEACKEFTAEGIPVYHDRTNFNIFPCESADCFYPNSNIGTEAPSTILHCPSCGMEFGIDPNG